ncbi:NUDIX domain-containing protein [Ornithinibacillus sp. FSL M8-0202]
MYPRTNTLGSIGGTIEFGEKSNETLMREFIEELGVEVAIE